MPSPRVRRPPEMVDFVAGYPGPAEVPYHGGSVEVVAALVYRDGVRIDWRMRSMPDLAWLPIDAEEATPPTPADSADAQDLVLRRGDLRRVSTFWEQSALSDDRGNAFELSDYRNGMSIKGGWQGEIAFLGSVTPQDARALTLRVGDLVIGVPLDSNAESGVGGEPRFLAGYPGPSPLPFHGGSVKVVAALLYTNEVVVEWLVRPIPDLSWIPFDEEWLARTLDRFRGKRRDRLASTIRESCRISELWNRARLTDDRGTTYAPTTGGSGALPGGHRGENAFSPTPPADALELNLTLEELSVSFRLAPRI